MNPYAAIARYRRRYFASRPDLQRRLARPVISVGNLAVGGRGKTPLVAHIAQLLRDAGERPSILTRGYARASSQPGVVVVRDPAGIRADLERGGDEPLMLARQLDGVAVLTSPNRYVAGRLAEHHFGCTVHILDDGFQHFALHRDADVVVVAGTDLTDARTLPFGRLREPADALAEADAVVALDDVEVSAATPLFHASVWMCAPVIVAADGTVACDCGCAPHACVADAMHPEGATIALAGIASPQRFFGGLRAMGWPVARELAYADHHRYTAKDVADIVSTARAHGADLVVTTAKDLVRLLPFRPLGVRLAVVPLRLRVTPEDAFRDWLLARVAAARSGDAA